AGLARLLVPFAPDGADAPLADLVLRLATAIGELPPPGLALADAVPADARDQVAHAVAAFLELDAAFTEGVTHVQARPRRAATMAPLDVVPDGAERDRILIAPPRGLVAALVAH